LNFSICTIPSADGSEFAKGSNLKRALFSIVSGMCHTVFCWLHLAPSICLIRSIKSAFLSN
jgi:hypothetical protein